MCAETTPGPRELPVPGEEARHRQRLVPLDEVAEQDDDADVDPAGLEVLAAAAVDPARPPPSSSRFVEPLLRLPRSPVTSACRPTARYRSASASAWSAKPVRPESASAPRHVCRPASRLASVSSSGVVAGTAPRWPCARRTPSTAAQSAPWRLRRRPRAASRTTRVSRAEAGVGSGSARLSQTVGSPCSCSISGAGAGVLTARFDGRLLARRWLRRAAGFASLSPAWCERAAGASRRSPRGRGGGRGRGRCGGAASRPGRPSGRRQRRAEPARLPPVQLSGAAAGAEASGAAASGAAARRGSVRPPVRGWLQQGRRLGSGCRGLGRGASRPLRPRARRRRSSVEPRPSGRRRRP